MLSFYQMDLLLRKNKRSQPQVREMFGDKFKTDLQNLIAAAGGQQSQPEQPAPAGQKPVKVLPVTKDLDDYGDEPDFDGEAGAPPAAAPTPPPAQQGAGEPSKPIGGASVKKQGLATAGRTGGKEGAIKSVIDPNDPSSAKAQAIKAGQEGRLRGGRGVSKAFTNTDDPDTTRLNMWNNMLKGQDYGNGRRVSSWAGLLQIALEDRGFDFGNDFEPGAPFQVAHEKGASQANGVGLDLPEIVVDTDTLKDATEQVWKWVGNDKRNQSGMMGVLVQFYEQVKSNPELRPIIMRGLQLQSKLFDPRIAGKKFRSIGSLASQLGKLTDGSELGGLAAGAEIPSGRKIDVEALMMLIDGARRNGLKTFEVQGSPRDPKSPVLVVPPDNMQIQSDNPLLGGTSMGTADYEDDPEITSAERVRRWRASLKKNPPAGPGAAPTAESNGWADICTLMEHWGF